MVVKWSACSPSIPTIRVRILLKQTVFFCKICVWKRTKINKKRSELSHFFKKVTYSINICTNWIILIWSHRCGLTGEDLNRRWRDPSELIHPEIFHTKGLLSYVKQVLEKEIFLFCDFHGHSRFVHLLDIKNFHCIQCDMRNVNFDQYPMS